MLPALRPAPIATSPSATRWCGLGACAVGAFYDDEAAALVGVNPAHEWVVHFAALGVKA